MCFMSAGLLFAIGHRRRESMLWFPLERASLSKVTFRPVTHTFELERLDFPATSRFESLSNSGSAIVSIDAPPS